MKAYESNRHHLNEVALDADLVGTAIEAMMATRIHWAGNSSELLRSLNLIADESQTRPKEWPVNANQLGRSLRRCAPLLRRAGIDVHFAVGGKRTVKLRRLTEYERNSSPSSPAHSATEEKPNNFNHSGQGDTGGPSVTDTSGRTAIGRGSSPDANPFNGNKKGDTGDAGDTLRPCSADGRGDGIPASLRQCAHCNRNGELGHVALGDGPMVWLHRECEAAWLKSDDANPHSPQSPIGNAT
jgi:hypothetical protein